MNPSKIKILYVITKGNFGGAQRYVFDLATNLPKEEFDVTVAMGEGDALKERLEKSGIRTIKIIGLKRDINIFGEIISFFHLIKLFKEERPHIIHLNSSKVGAIGALAGRLTKVPKIIFTGHGWAFNEKRNIISRALIAFIHWLTIVATHTTIAVSKRIRDQISLFPFTKGKISIIHNGVSNIEFLSKEDARSELSDNKEGLWIGTISELHKNKGVDFIIKAFAKIKAQHPDAHLYIIGGGEEEKNLKSLVKKHSLESQIHLLGFRDNASKYLKAFDIFTLTSRTEAFPYVPLEAGLAELPVIASRVGGIPEIISNKENGILVEPGNIFEIQFALRDLLSSEEKRLSYGKLLSLKVRNEFSFEEMLGKTITLYKTK